MSVICQGGSARKSLFFNIFTHIFVYFPHFTIFSYVELIKFCLLRSLEPIFKKIAKSHLSAQFFIRVFVLGWYTYFEAAQVLFSFCFREKRSKL